MFKNISIIGSTGVLGTKLVKSFYKNKIPVSLLTCNTNITKLIKQKKLLKVKNTIVLKNNSSKMLNGVNFGFDSLERYIRQSKINILYILDVGFDTLKILDLIISTQKNCILAIANKEILVAGGKILIDEIINSGNKILPLDSEHFSLYDLVSNRKFLDNDIDKIYLTASGGPFFFKKNFNPKKIKLLDAIQHPIWKMGYKNSIDSSNLVNKILETFELSSLLNIPLSKIGITISPEAFTHSIIYYKDHRIVLNCFQNDMIIPMLKPFSKTIKYPIKKIFLKKIDNSKFTFHDFNKDNFQIFKYINKIYKFNHSQQITFMTLNSIAVNKFISNKLTYFDIIPFIFKNMNLFNHKKKFKNLYDIINYIDNIKPKLAKL